MNKTATAEPQIIFRKSKPIGVILDIHEYAAILRRLEDAEDLQEIKKIRKSKLSFRPLESFLEENPL